MDSRYTSRPISYSSRRLRILSNRCVQWTPLIRQRRWALSEIITRNFVYLFMSYFSFASMEWWLVILLWLTAVVVYLITTITWFLSRTSWLHIKSLPFPVIPFWLRLYIRVAASKHIWPTFDISAQLFSFVNRSHIIIRPNPLLTFWYTLWALKKSEVVWVDWERKVEGFLDIDLWGLWCR